MNERRRIEDRLRKKEQEIQQLEEQIKDARVYMQALQDVLKLIPKDSYDDTGITVLRPGSAMEQARDLIKQKGRPLHVEEILKMQGKPVTRETKAALSGSIAAYVRRGEIFTRPAPNTFGLVDGPSTLPVEPEPPADFGKAKPADLDDDIPF